MSWRVSQDAHRARSLRKYDAAEVEGYESLVGSLSPEDEAAHRSDLERIVALRPGMAVLDAGAGTGTLCALLAKCEGLALTALEPAPAMLAKLRGKAGLEGVRTVEGFCDAAGDRGHFGEAEFDVVLSRQLGNVLFDPLAAFRNWHHWLVPGGSAVVIDGTYGRDSWSGKWEEEIDALPLSAHQSLALVPYLLEQAGFEIESVGPMTAVNARPSTRTPRYAAVARKPRSAAEEGRSR